MANENENLSKILKQRRLMIPLTLGELAAKSGVSSSYLGRVERGDRFPSARVLLKIAKPLRFSESQLFTLAGYLSSEPSAEVESSSGGRLDPYVVTVLSQEPGEIQRGVVTILTVLKSMASNIGFAEYVRSSQFSIELLRLFLSILKLMRVL